MKKNFPYSRLVPVVTAILITGFMTTITINYLVSRKAIRQAIIQTELPVTSDTIYSEIQKDLIRPVFISSMMAHDTFLRDWVIAGERQPALIIKYLKEIKDKYSAFTSFFVSDKTRTYYQNEGILKIVNETNPRDSWYFRVRAMTNTYEINVDPDMANNDTMTIFINYRVLDYQGRFLGAAGVGLNVESVKKRLLDYQKRYNRAIYFVNAQSDIILSVSKDIQPGMKLRDFRLKKSIPDIFKGQTEYSLDYRYKGRSYLLNVRYIPELNWYLFVEKEEGPALAAIRQNLFFSIGVGVLVSLVVFLLILLTVSRFNGRLEEMAATDWLTGVFNRRSMELFLNQAIRESARTKAPACLLLFDLDEFKLINDNHGHQAGDDALRLVVRIALASFRSSDIICRWGGDEFMILLKNCPLTDARARAERFRQDLQKTPVISGNLNFSVTASIGITEFKENHSLDDLIRLADTALYQSKQGGRNQVS